ncbi:MAG: peptidase S9 [Sphingobacteriales bacterium 40-81]|nr:MAG: peptidase S9 [Sphingobacteriales bacterium 40-81]
MSMKKIVFFLLLLTNASVHAQKKPLDHTVYDSWQSIGEKKISNNGKWIAYVINVQEGDGNLVIQSTDASYKNTIPRGYNVTITPDSRFVIFKIKPPYADTRQAQIKKKKPDEFPKDSLAIMELGKDSITKIARVKSYQVPKKNAQWIAWQLEKPLADTSKKKPTDSLALKIDSTRKNTAAPTPEQAKKRQKITNPPAIKDFIENDYADDDKDGDGKAGEGTAISIYNLNTNTAEIVQFVNEYLWSKTGNILLIETTRNKKDSLGKAAVQIFRTAENRFDTITKGGNDFKNFAIDENGTQIAYVAERDSSAKALQKFYKLWYWKNGQDSAIMLADKNIAGMPIGWGISENAALRFSKSGKRLFAGSAPVQPPKDTTLVDIDLVKVDIWNYKDDYLQTMQLRNLDRELKRSYLAVINLDNKRFVQLADVEIPMVQADADGDADIFAGITDINKRIAMQWEGNTLKDVYSIKADDGTRQLIKKDVNGQIGMSPGGKYIFWYDAKAKTYFTWKNGALKNITAKIPVKLYQEDFDMPTTPSPYGIMDWTQSDLAVLIYDRFDVWQVDPADVIAPVNITKTGRKNLTRYRYIQTDEDEQFVTPSRELLFYSFNETNKNSGLAKLNFVSDGKLEPVFSGAFLIERNVLKAADSNVYAYTKETYTAAPDLYTNANWNKEIKLSAINPQQAEYNWGTAELFKWKAYNGKEATGIVYKPENYDPKKKYPAICYFYEKLSDGLFQYIPPVPTPSRLNISFFVSRGYIVFAPDISYTDGYPGRSAYNYIVSGARALVKKGWVDSTRIGLQGQSWGGYQTAYLITQTKLFKAAWAGAPVANMTSAYGGIRWESGMNRQFQYERTQSRIGATLWEKPQLYMQNSPLFYLPKVTTPLVIMHNDNDGAVPWYQGIELFTGLRRLGKPVWLLNYNGEAHNLIQRKNRKDIQIREQQFFDWLLKDDKPTQWLRDGVPATMKGKIWGLE